MSTYRRAGPIGPSSHSPVSLTAWALLVGAVLLVQLLIARLGLPPEGRLLVGDEHMYVALAKDWAAGGEKPIDPFWPPGYSWLFGMISHNLGPLEKCGFIFSQRKEKRRIYSLNKETAGRLFELFDYHSQKYCPTQGSCLTERGLRQMRKKEAASRLHVTHG